MVGMAGASNVGSWRGMQSDKWKVSFTQTTTHVPILTAKSTDTSNRTHIHNCCRTICIQQLRIYNGISKFKAIVCQLTLSVVRWTRVCAIDWFYMYGTCVCPCACVFVIVSGWMDVMVGWVDWLPSAIHHLFFLLPHLPSFGPFSCIYHQPLTFFPSSPLFD